MPFVADFKNDMTVSASVTANHPINPSSGVFYFEIVIDRFKGNSAISVGIASKSLRKNCQVGNDETFASGRYLDSAPCQPCAILYILNMIHLLLVDRLGLELLGIP